MVCTKRFCLLSWLVFLGGAELAQAQMTPPKTAANEWIKQNEAKAKEINQRLWSLAELGLVEHQSSQTLLDWLATNGFTIERNVADMPTAFVANFGSGHPIIGILAEYDALPGLSQKAVSMREEREGSANGHACGHSVFGTASTMAAIAVRQALAQHGVKGTVRLYGTPAIKRDHRTEPRKLWSR